LIEKASCLTGSSGGGGGFSDTRSSQPQDFEEYDAGEDETEPNSSTRSSQPTTRSHLSSRTSKPTPTTPKPSIPVAVKQPEVNLFDFDDDEPLGGGTTSTTTSPPPPPKPTANLFASTPIVQAANSLDGKSNLQSSKKTKRIPTDLSPFVRPICVICR